MNGCGPNVFLVWDKWNGDEETSKRVDADGPADAAIAYARQDSDGWTDGLYHEHPQPIVVKSAATGFVWTFEVRAEFAPSFHAVLVESEKAEGE